MTRPIGKSLTNCPKFAGSSFRPQISYPKFLQISQKSRNRHHIPDHSKFLTEEHSSGVTCGTHWYMLLSAWWKCTDMQLVCKDKYCSNYVENIRIHRTKFSGLSEQKTDIFTRRSYPEILWLFLQENIRQI